MHKSYLKNEAMLLRQQGYSYELIKNKIGVSKSTLCDWLKLIPFEPNSEVLERMKHGRIKSTETIKRLYKTRLLNSNRIANVELGSLSKRDLMMLGIGLYIGEGGKYNKGFIQFSNSDPRVIKLAMSWFMEILNVDIENFYLMAHVYPDNDINKILKFWSELTKVPIGQFGKTYVDNRKNKSIKNKGKLVYGTLHIRIRGLKTRYARVGLFQKVLAWIDSVENFNFAGIV